MYLDEAGLNTLIKKTRVTLSNSIVPPASSNVIKQYYTRRFTYKTNVTPLSLAKNTRTIFTNDWASSKNLSNYGSYSSSLEWIAPSAGIVLVATEICTSGASGATGGVMHRVLHESGNPYWRMRAGGIAEKGYIDVGVRSISSVSRSVKYTIGSDNIYTYRTYTNFDIYTGEKVCMFYDNCSDSSHKLYILRMTTTFMPGGQFIDDLSH